MIRLFKQHEVRSVTELNGIWDFSAEKSAQQYQLPVPGCWEQHPDLASYRGIGTYRKQLMIHKTSDYLLEFKGVSHTGDIYLDGKKVGHHYNAYTPFKILLPNLIKGNHELKVVVDNTFSVASALHVPNDYYTYGGITRGVQLMEVSSCFIKNIHFTPKKVADKWQGKVVINVVNLTDTTEKRQLTVTLAGLKYEKEVSLAPNSTTTVDFLETFKEITPWSHEQPQLYFLKVQLKDDEVTQDDYIERVGFREVKVVADKIYLNDKKIFLKGFNRHEDHPAVGCALPLQLMVKDLDLMADLGANSVRTCHYPNDELFLDLCDERGVLVWEENHARGFDLAQMENPNFDEQCRACNEEMVAEHYNHPAIIIWGILNECASETEAGRKKYQMQYDQIRSLDQTRPMTSATCRHFKDICLDLPDIVSFNMYTGWYQDMTVAERHQQELDWINSTPGKGKPVIVSEFGGGAIYGYRNPARVKWSEERQADILAENLALYNEDDRLAGMYIWQLADCKVTEEKWFAVRPRSQNNKGIVDEYRRPKLAYDVVKKYFHEQ